LSLKKGLGFAEIDCPLSEIALKHKERIDFLSQKLQFT
jgi:hypothetical protein